MIRIVIAEDEEEVRIRLARYLDNSDRGYAVVGQAGDGEQALTMIKELRPDILLTDICMPRVSGLELIRAIRETDPELPVIVVSGYDEFSYAREAMSLGVREYLLKPFLPKELFAVLDKAKALLEQRAKAAAEWQNLNEELQKNLRYSRQRFFYSLLRGRLGWQEREVTAGFIGFDLEADWFCAGLLDAKGAEEDEVEALWGTVPDAQADGCRLYAVPGEQVQLLCFFSARGLKRNEMQARLSAGLEHVCAALQNQTKAVVRCALGRPYRHCEELELSYKEALDTWRMSFGPGHPVQSYPLEPGVAWQSGGQSAGLAEKLLLDIQLGDKAAAQAGLDALMNLYATYSPVLASQISMELLKLVLHIAELMREADEPEAAWSEQNLIGYLRQNFSILSLRETGVLLGGYVERCCGHFAQRNADDSDRLIRRARLVIEENLGNEEFDLEQLAQSLYFSATYVRQLFKSRMGESFSDYLFRRRMELAGQLMRNPSLKVQDIAERTGYKDQRYFARCFKKFYHCTPTEYRSQSDAF